MKSNSADHSDEKAFRVAYLIAGYIRKTLTEEEHDELDAWVEASDENMKLFEDLTDEDHIEANLAWMDSVQTEQALAKAKQGIVFTPQKKVKNTINWRRYAAAASIILAIAAIFFLRTGPVPPRTEVSDYISPPAQDVQPGGDRATLTLGDGTIIDLQKTTVGTIKAERGATIQKKGEGELMYDEQTDIKEAAYHTLATPKGGQYALTLSDGTKVWLNAESSLRYPAQFTDTARVVELKGEGFFEVAKDKARPFLVRTTTGEEVKVLGTQFNVMAYGNEEGKKVTLVEGRIRIATQNGGLTLKPGQQAVVEKNDLKLAAKPDIEAAVGWKRGEFVFHDADIYAIMRQVERWYDVNVIYRATSSEHFNFSLSRKEPLSKLLHLMELTGKIHFKIDQKTVYVLP